MKKWIFVVLLCGFFGAEAGGKIYAAEQGDVTATQDVFQTIYDSVPLEEVENVLQELKDEQMDFSFQQYVDKVIQGEAELSLQGIGEEIKTCVSREFQVNQHTIYRLLLCGILSGVFLNFATSAYEKEMSQTGFYLIYFFVVTILLGGFLEASTVAKTVLDRVLVFMKALVPSFSIALTWSAGSATSMAFYQAALATMAIVEQVLVGIFLPLVQVYFLISIANPLMDGKFARMADLVRSLIRFGTKTILMVMIGHQGIQGLITPALDGVKRGTLFRTASSLPGVGNVFGGVTDTIIGSGVLIKSAIGVGGLVAICVLCIVPLVRLWVFTITYKGLAAFTQPVTDKRLVLVFQSAADSGRLLVHIVFMTAVMFLLTLTIIIAATNHVY
nr:stage III sporulation protein AE [Eubacterium sp.]